MNFWRFSLHFYAKMLVLLWVVNGQADGRGQSDAQTVGVGSRVTVG